MNVEVQAPSEYAGDLMGDFNSRRGRISGMDSKGSMQIIRAQVPMAEMLTYQNDLISMTQGRASFSMEFSHYDFVPQQQADKVVAAAKADFEGEKRFAPFLRLYLEGNPLSDAARNEQIPALAGFGVKVMP